MVATRTFRFAVLTRGRPLARWERQSIATVCASGGQLVAVLEAPGSTPRPGFVPRLAERLAAGRRDIAANRPEASTQSRLRLDSSGALDAIRVLKLDFVLAFEPTAVFLPLVADPDSIAVQGIWAHAFAAGGGPPALPPGFDAIAQGDTLALVALVRVTNSGQGQPLEQEWLRVEPHSYRRTRTMLTNTAAEIAARYLRRGRTLHETSPPLQLPVAVCRSSSQTARMLTGLLWRALVFHARRALFRQDWNVGVVRRSIADSIRGLDAHDIEWLPPLAGARFLADPFGIPQEDGTCLLLAEEYAVERKRGRIVAATIDGARYISPPTPILDLGVHVSYPYVVPGHADPWMIVPESSAASDVALYTLEHGAATTKRVATLLDGFAAVDPTIFEHRGRWWLFATDGTRGADSHLHVWHSESARGPWVTHLLNPVKCDVRSARPGGSPFIDNGVLYRPAQDDSGQYGGALVINRIDVLTPEAFEETTVARLDPDGRGPYPSGIHTLSSVGEMVLVDGKRYRFAPLSKLRGRIRKRSD